MTIKQYNETYELKSFEKKLKELSIKIEEIKAFKIDNDKLTSLLNHFLNHYKSIQESYLLRGYLVENNSKFGYIASYDTKKLEKFDSFKSFCIAEFNFIENLINSDYPVLAQIMTKDSIGFSTMFALKDFNFNLLVEIESTGDINFQLVKDKNTLAIFSEKELKIFDEKIELEKSTKQNVNQSLNKTIKL